MCIRDRTYPIQLDGEQVGAAEMSIEVLPSALSVLWPRSVSYTHLDVYKRQFTNMSRRVASSTSPPATASSMVPLEAVIRASACLLYTSRCV